MAPDTASPVPGFAPDPHWLGDTSQLVPAHRLIVLSFFDGIGSALVAIENLCGQPSMAMAWEIDESCIAVTSQAFPYVIHRGDVFKDSPTAIAEYIRKRDPHQLCSIVCVAAPPCPDFSRVTGHGQGFDGTEGCKFKHFAEFANELESQLDGWDFHHLIENVVMQQKSEIQWVSEKTHTSPLVVDAADFGWISRPRIWWTRVDWSQFTTNPASSGDLRWGTLNKLPRLYVDAAYTTMNTEVLGGLKFSQRVENHEIRLPCMTTPAPDEHGRPAPKKTRGKVDSSTRQRWLEGGRQWAPWHYDREAMLSTADDELVLPPIALKELLHHLPQGHTTTGRTELRTRHRMMGNSWHVGVAQFLLFFILSSCRASVGCEVQQPIPHPPQMSALQFLVSMAQSEDPAMGPVPRRVEQLTRAPVQDQWEHWEVSKGLTHPMLQEPQIEPGALQVFRKLRNLGDISRLRNEVVNDIKDMVADWQDHTNDWIQSRPPHVRAVYESHGTPTTQIPVFLELLKLCQYPAMEDITQDLSWGFDYVGRQHPGPGWLQRLDEEYAHPISLDTFASLNAQYIERELQKRGPDQHWATMLEELVEEKKCGRVQGPFAAPSSWPIQTVAPTGHHLLPTPAGPIFPSICFAVVQSDKIRRCEDLRRSFHNQTIFATQTPTHHHVDVYADVIKFMGQQAIPVKVWSHDLDSAYRQFPVKDQAFSYTILFTESGPTLWRHCALAFGAVSSVWSFNRAADCLMLVARKLLLSNLFHYVDDFAAVEASDIATSGFEAFTDMCLSLGLRTKPKKATPPDTKQKLLGVDFVIGDTGLQIQPCPDRVHKLQVQIRNFLDYDRLQPSEAQKLAGRLVFLQTTIFGQVGKSALQPIYSRAAHQSADAPGSIHLNTGLRRALTNILQLLVDMRPRWLPFDVTAPQSLIYTDAFFELGQRVLKPGSEVPTSWNHRNTKNMKNGWGVVAHTFQETFYSLGRVPPTLLHAYCHRKAFIYFLEAITPLLALIILQSRLAKYVVLFVDNSAALAALQRGYGKDDQINNLISVFWSIVNRLGLFLHFCWVPSSHNVSDKVSRHDLSEAHSQDWTHLHSDTAEIYDILTRAATDSNFAMFEAVNCLLDGEVRSPTHPRAEREVGARGGVRKRAP